MALVVLVVVIGLPTVGVLLMAALLSFSGRARFWTERLGVMMFLAGLFGMASGMIGAVGSAVVKEVPTGRRSSWPQCRFSWCRWCWRRGVGCWHDMATVPRERPG